MNLQFFDNDGLERELQKLAPFQRIAFAASCCERMFPFYQTFSETDKWGNQTILRNALDEIWQSLQEKSINKKKIVALKEECEKDGIFPGDDDEFGEGSGEYSLFVEAGETVVAIGQTLEACLEPTNQFVLDANQSLKNAIEYYISNFDESFRICCQGKSLDEEMKELANHTLVITEIAKQEEDLQRLKEAEILEDKLLEWLRNSSKSSGETMVRMFYSTQFERFQIKL